MWNESFFSAPQLKCDPLGANHWSCMTDTQVAVFRPKSRSLLKPTLLTAAVISAVLIGKIWRSSPAPESWTRVVVVLGGGFVAFFGLIGGALFLRARRQAITILPSGMQGPTARGQQAFCGWDNITDAQVVHGDALEYLSVSGRYLPEPIRLPLALLDDRDFVALIDRHVPEGSPLSLALRSAGA